MYVANCKAAFSIADEAVMMVKQFDSMYVADSVAVMNLKGELLGYVPRRHISRFPHDTNFGHVYAINQDAASLWRLTVSFLCSASHAYTKTPNVVQFMPFIWMQHKFADCDSAPQSYGLRVTPSLAMYIR